MRDRIFMPLATVYFGVGCFNVLPTMEYLSKNGPGHDKNWGTTVSCTLGVTAGIIWPISLPVLMYLERDRKDYLD